MSSLMPAQRVDHAALRSNQALIICTLLAAFILILLSSWRWLPC